MYCGLQNRCFLRTVAVSQSSPKWFELRSLNMPHCAQNRPIVPALAIAGHSSGGTKLEMALSVLRATGVLTQQYSHRSQFPMAGFFRSTLRVILLIACWQIPKICYKLSELAGKRVRDVS